MTQKIVFVAGMHRSGTSLTMQALSALGAKPGGAMIEGDDHNKKGYWEAAEIVAFHDELLSEIGRGWGLPEHMIPVSQDWFSSDQAKEPRAQIRALLKARLASLNTEDVLAIKDPRMSLFLPLWIDAAKDLGADPSVIVCLRHPMSVAKSLEKRDETSIDGSLALWLTYTASSLTYARHVPVFLSQYDNWLADNSAMFAQLGRFVGLDVSNVDSPFDTSLVNNTGNEVVSNALVANWWNDLSSLSGENVLSEDLWGKAEGFVDNAQLMSVLAKSIRAEVGETATFAAKRDLESYRTAFADLLEKHAVLGEERDTLADRAHELHDAFQSLLQNYEKVPGVIRRLTRLRK